MQGSLSLYRRVLACAPLVLLALSACFATRAQAVIPDAATRDDLYAQGYLVVTYYHGVSNQGTSAGTTTSGLNEALADAYANNLAAYFPAGTYLVNGTLKAYTSTGNDDDTPFAETPHNHLSIIGSTKQNSRPLIRLDPAAAGFGNPNSPMPVVEFMNFDTAAAMAAGDRTQEAASESYHQMLRGVDIDCSGKLGAICLYFNAAQESSIENVSITATGAHTGIRGLPGRGWGAVNISVEGGKYGIDTAGTGAAGNTVAGGIFRNQTVSAIRHDGFAPLVIVGFEIQTLPGSTNPALTIERGTPANSSAIGLIDGKITVDSEPAMAVIDNRVGKNFYARNVHIVGARKLVRSGSNAAVERTGPRQFIREYSYTDQSPPDGVSNSNKESFTFINGVLLKNPGPLVNGEVLSIPASPPAIPANLVSQHIWKSLPSVDDTDAVNASTLGVVPGVDRGALQQAINTHRKLFLPKGIYTIGSPLVLRHDTILFGADRNLTRIEVDRTRFSPTVPTPMITTDSDPDGTATTYLGDLSIGVDASRLNNDYFEALVWKAGRNSMVHIGQIYRWPENVFGRMATQGHSLLHVENTGGGRWYFPGSRKPFTGGHPDFHILKVEGTTQPLWIYGLNAEHPIGCDTYVKFDTASNVRIYGVKTEFPNFPPPHTPPWSVLCGLITYIDAVNVAQFGHGAMRNATLDRGNIDFKGTGTARVLAALIAPQNDNGAPGTPGYTVAEDRTGSLDGVPYPHVVSLFKRGTITVADEAAMTHDDVSYGTDRIFYTGMERDAQP